MLLSLTLLLAATGVPAAAPLSAQASSVAPAPDADKKICKRFGPSESRMGAKRLCKTAAEWKLMDRTDERVEVKSDRAGRSH